MAQQNDRVLLSVTAAIYRNEKENAAMHWVLQGQGKARGVACIFRGVRNKGQYKRVAKVRAARGGGGCPRGNFYF